MNDLIKLFVACVLLYYGLQFTNRAARGIPGVGPVLDLLYKIALWILRFVGCIIRQSFASLIRFIGNLADQGSTWRRTFLWFHRTIRGRGNWLPH